MVELRVVRYWPALLCGLVLGVPGLCILTFAFTGVADWNERSSGIAGAGLLLLVGAAALILAGLLWRSDAETKAAGKRAILDQGLDSTKTVKVSLAERTPSAILDEVP